MATAGRLGLFRRRGDVSGRDLERLRAKTITIHSPRGALRASAARLDASDRQEAKVQRLLRQGWQSDAWAYRDTIGELRYAVNFLANAAARMRIFPACYPDLGESDDPVTLDKIAGIPENAVSVAAQAIADLGGGRQAISGIMHGVSTNKSVAGESYLLGRTDPQTREETWSVRSVDELVVYDDKWHLREIPDDRQNSTIPWIPLDPELTVISRMWTPHPRFQLLADSPFKAMLDDCESLAILRRMIRATGRSRLATRGFLLMPSEISLKVPLEDDGDPEADPFMGALAQAMMDPIENEGAADAAVPIVLQGPAEALDKVRLLEMPVAFDAEASKTRQELLAIMATTFDLPPEVILGMADLNHWTAWQVDDNTFRQIEPHVVSCCDDLTGAYFRPYLAAAGIPEQWVRRMVFWYDPTEVVVHPDQTKDALDLHDRLVISDEALLRIAGMDESDRPTKQEVQVRLLEKMRNWPPNLVMAFLHAWDPTLIAPPITVAGTIPGIKPGGVDTGEPPVIPGAPAPAAPASSNGTPPAPAVDKPDTGPPPAQRPEPTAPVTAAGVTVRESHIANRTSTLRLSRRLQSIDADLRARLQTAANAALLRSLERAGARLRTKVARDETLRTKIAHRANERVAALLGPDVVQAAGLTAAELVSGDWSGLRAQFYAWTSAAQAQAVRTALSLGQVDDSSPAAASAKAAMAAGQDAAWDTLSRALSARAEHLLYHPDPNAGPGDWGELNADTLVPAGTIRAALAIAGGTPTASVASDDLTGALTLTDPAGQIGTGETISGLLTDAGGQSTGYQWVHGPSLHPFEGHEDLDGVEFQTFDDDQLQNDGDWPDNQFFMPGDHDGCLCDFMPLWDFPGGPSDESTEEE